jgi:hypothetical protein
VMQLWGSSAFFWKNEGGKNSLNDRLTSYVMVKLDNLWCQCTRLSTLWLKGLSFLREQTKCTPLNFIKNKLLKEKPTVCLNDQWSCPICLTNLWYHLHPLVSISLCLFGKIILARN